MIIILTILILITYIFISVIKYKIAKKSKKTNRLDLEGYQINLVFSFMILTMFLIIFLFELHFCIKDYNKYYFKEKNKNELLILENNIFSGTIIKWWAKDYPELK